MAGSETRSDRERFEAGGYGRRLLSEDEWHDVIGYFHLSGRESQVVQRMFEGKKQVAIATELGISSHTVHTHIERIYGKLGVHDRCEMVLRVFGAHMALNASGERGGARGTPGAR